MRDVAPDDDSEFSEIYSLRKKSNTRIRFWRTKIKLLVGFFIVLVLLILAMSFILIFTNSTKILRLAKTKRSLKANAGDNESESAEAAQNIDIIPKGRVENFTRRANQHPNHRYLEISPKSSIDKKVMKDQTGGSGWSPKPFRVEKKLEDKNTQRQFPYLKSLGNSMKFKGVFTYFSPEDNLINNPSSENLNYYKEINNFMQNYPDAERKENLAEKKAFRSHGAVVREHSEDIPRREMLNTHQSGPSKPKQSWFKERFEKKPLTILLDIYPVTEANDLFKKEGHELNHVLSPLRGEFSEPRGVHSRGKFPFPRESRNGMIIKLNLYAKGGKFSRHQNSIGETEAPKYLKYRKNAEKKSFGWFSTEKEEKQEPEQCSLMALRPDGKHVTARWKNKKGEWIQANHLLVKHLKSR